MTLSHLLHRAGWETYPAVFTDEDDEEIERPGSRGPHRARLSRHLPIDIEDDELRDPFDGEVIWVRLGRLVFLRDRQPDALANVNRVDLLEALRDVSEAVSRAGRSAEQRR